MNGFTLAEVLITLGIIGVVAAMTMPTLMAQHRKKEISTSLKKFYTTMSQAILMSELENGPSGDWEKPATVKDDDGNIDNAGQRAAALTYFNRYLKNYIKYIGIDENPEEIQNEDGQAHMIRIYLADGTNFLLNNGTCAHFTYDANGKKNPNKSGYDNFGFLLCPSSERSQWVYSGKSLIPYAGASDTTREKALQTCKDAPGRCTLLLMMDGWEFKPDYPHKI